MYHIALHFIVPLFFVLLFYKKELFKKQLKVYCILMATMIVDIDHLLADPIYDPNRCSIGFHPLHALWLMPVYICMAFYPKTRLIGIGLIFHMMLDSMDCYHSLKIWYQ
ncbi:MAG TPA: hypothetical protein DHW71_07115 [Gammaproteobacteria bacterium]|nr:hypothetical protein [Gammaproteobacteria bacterium]MEC8010760.1 DUF6122 family protein [Pseudomonadota bacterium]HBF09856.1 hypothetical protein [Gammaproteobacteria bacterium]HCK92737.1 hypothetical protein [Gammaproteobacteria bacterium]|tara:strand:- start:1300 stop:1626 length:327 start_codon:yes stop_codon:yes gene_type:complete